MGLPRGSKKKARFFELSDLRGCICDLPHKRPLPRENRAGNNEDIPADGIMVWEDFLLGWRVTLATPRQQGSPLLPQPDDGFSSNRRGRIFRCETVQ
jgi:hypothetical protein